MTRSTIVSGSDHRVEAEGGTLFARTWVPSSQRDESPILLFHDSLGSVALWREFPELLARATGRRVVAYDRLGFGRSDVRTGPLAFDFIAAEAGVVPRVCEALGIGNFVAFGHSVGGAMAIATAARLGEQCEAVITVSAQSFAEERTLAGVRTARTAFAQPGRLERLARYHGDRARWVLDAWTGTWLAPEFAHWSLDDELRGVRCPVLAIHGDQDEYGSVEHAWRIARLTSGPSRAVMLDGCGHVPHREQPERVLRETVGFLESTTSAPGGHAS